MTIASIRENLKNIPKRTVHYFMYCLAGVLIFVFAGIVPGYWERAQLDKKNNEVRYRIEEIKALQSLYAELRSGPGRVSSVLTLPRRIAMQRTQINRADASFREIAARCGMKVVSIAPNFSVAGDSRVLAVQVSLKGNFENFRNVLMKLGELPYVDQIKEFAIQRAGNSRALDITMNILLAVN